MTKIISFQGFKGAYSDMACHAVYPDHETLPCVGFRDAFMAVENGEADLAMIPVDNTLAGRVADVHHLMPQSHLNIIGEHFQPIRHALMGVKGAKIKDIKHVHSHVHAIPQCRKVISELGIESHIHVDTAGAAKEVAERKNKAHAAIASELAAKIYGLEILRGDVQDADHNTTRFLILSPKPEKPYLKEESCITSLLFTVRNIPAALYKCLSGFATNGLSMSKLESYVDPNFDAAQFYVDVDGHCDSEAFRNALEELGFFARNVRILGCYKAHDFRKPSC